ncbi:MAG: chaperone modulator CbpM [Patiriisocius sp.]|uniref:chaperone modulator CbpM n=1 Tax=Patiriisocius sp. TaxID=2822396 RepID=UPI003EF5ACCF
MDTTQFIEVTHLCKQYNITETLFNNFHEIGLITITVVETRPCIHIENIDTVEKIIRLHQELDVNPEGIDVIINLQEKMDALQQEINHLKQRLLLYDRVDF